MEILITTIILIVAITIIYKNIRSSCKGKCNCTDCSKQCSMRKE